MNRKVLAIVCVCIAVLLVSGYFGYYFYAQSTLPEVAVQFSHVNFNGLTFSGSFTLKNVGKQTINEIIVEAMDMPFSPYFYDFHLTTFHSVSLNFMLFYNSNTPNVNDTEPSGIPFQNIVVSILIANEVTTQYQYYLNGQPLN
jgi:hypothetical protein